MNSIIRISYLFALASLMAFAAAAPSPAKAPSPSPSSGNSSLPNIVFITTGGTIASVPDANGNLIPAANGQQLLSAVPGMGKLINAVDIIPVAKIDSSDATPEFWVDVATAVKEQLAKADVDGVIVLHGTDTLEQTAWYLQCIDGIGNSGKSVVLTGSMRSSTSPFMDGPANMYSAAIVASDPLSKNYGVVVAFENNVYSARYLTKFSSNNADAFEATNGMSKIASVLEEPPAVVFYVELDADKLCGGGFPLPATNTSMPQVALTVSYPGANGTVLDYYRNSGNVGVVIEGLGAGNIGGSLGLAAAKLAPTDFKIVVAKLPTDGISTPSYGCDGCLGALISQGVVQALALDGFQSRIVTMLALTENSQASSEQLQEIFNNITYSMSTPGGLVPGSDAPAGNSGGSGGTTPRPSSTPSSNENSPAAATGAAVGQKANIFASLISAVIFLLVL